MLTKGDEYPIHQLPEPVAFSGSDRNFYDRFFFNGYSPDGSVFFAAALGVYPHLNIIDGAVSILTDGVQKSVHVSRILGMERMDIRVGPLSVDILEPLNQIRLRFADAEGIDLDVRFEGRHFPVEEPRFTHRQGPRMLIDCTRMTQNGRWTGHITVDGAKIDVQDFYGTRDRSWGVRPIGARDAQPVVPMQMPQYYWLWAPVNFDKFAHFYHINEDALGSPWNTRSVLAKDGAAHDGLLHLARPGIEVEWRPKTRRVQRAVVKADEHNGRPCEVHYEPIQEFLMKGIGYGHPEWGHGAYKGGYAIEREDFVPADMPWQRLDNLHIQAVVKATYYDADGVSSTGIGVLEQLCIGPSVPNQWKDIIDADG